MAPIDASFAKLATLAPADALATMILLSIRIYADFAGYSLLAIGVSNWFGLPAMDNFRQPYFGRGIIDFWSRWHISLSTWVRDYLYFPLSRYLLRRWGAKRAFWVQSIAHISTMCAIGLWHGIAGTFFIWGLWHGLLITLQHAIGPRLKSLTLPSRLRTVLIVFITWLVVAIGWVFFRAPSVSTGIMFFQHLLSGEPFSDLAAVWGLRMIIPVVLLLAIDAPQALSRTGLFVWQLGLPWRVALGLLMVIAIFYLRSASNVPFIYRGF